MSYTKEERERHKLTDLFFGGQSRRIRPELNKKSHFKAATGILMQNEPALNLQDDMARDLVKETFRVTGTKLKEIPVSDLTKRFQVYETDQVFLDNKEKKQF